MASAKLLSSEIIRKGSQISEEWRPLEPKHALSILSGLSQKRDLALARKAYVLVIESGLNPIGILTNHLIRLFSECGSLREAEAIFCKAPNFSAYTWHAIISAHSTLGEPIKSLDLYNTMQRTGVKPDKVVFVCVLKICSIQLDIENGRLIHNDIIRNIVEADDIAQTSLINMYVKCGYLEDAWKVFEESQTRDVVMWGAIISGYSEHEHPTVVLELFEKMLENGIHSDRVTFTCALKACGNLNRIGQGNVLYHLILKQQDDTDIVVNSSIVDMYAKHGNLKEAKKVFNSMPSRDVISWSAIIRGYTEFGEEFLALEAYQNFLQEGLRPDAVMFLSVIKACGGLSTVHLGMLVHDQIIKTGLESEVEITNTLISMYAKCRCLTYSIRVFERLRDHYNVISWDVMIAGYAHNGQANACLELFAKMQCLGVMPAGYTYSYVVKACVETGTIDLGRKMHKCIVAIGVDSDNTIGNSLVLLYGNLGHVEEACKVFDGLLQPDVVSWSMLIAGYAEVGLGPCALDCFKKMQECGLEADKYTYTSVLKGCGSMGAVDMGRLIHILIIQSCTEIDNVVNGTLIDMYVKFESLEDACKVFGEGINCDLVSWNTLIEGYVQHEQSHLALNLYNQMQNQNILPESSTYIAVLRACAPIGAKTQGKLIHSDLVKDERESDIVICNTLIDMYGKCAQFNEARKIFECLPKRNVVSWNAMIAGYSHHGLSRNALQYFHGMVQQGWKPNATTYTSILGACNRACEVEQALGHFVSMTEDHGLRPTVEHFDCVIDLLCRAGLLEEADRLLQSIPPFADSFARTSLLSACKVYENIDVGRHCFQHIARLNPASASSYMLMSNIYANAEKQDACTYTLEK